MSIDTEIPAGEQSAIEAAAGPQRIFVFNGAELPDPGASFTPEQVREVWAGQYPALQNAKIKTDTKTDAQGVKVTTYTFVQNVGHLG